MAHPPAAWIAAARPRKRQRIRKLAEVEAQSAGRPDGGSRRRPDTVTPSQSPVAVPSAPLKRPVDLVAQHDRRDDIAAGRAAQLAGREARPEMLSLGCPPISPFLVVDVVIEVEHADERSH